MLYYQQLIYLGRRLKMISIQNTQNLTGVTVFGDFHDFEELYDTLHTIVGDEDEYLKYDEVRLRVLGVCYDLRHAIMGHRGAKHVPNGLDRDKLRSLSITGSEMNIYLSFEVLLPEMVFVCYALNDYIYLHEKKHKTHMWDPTISAVRKFQSAFAKYLQETLTETKFSQLKKHFTHSIYSRTNKYEGYATQYVDKHNIKWIEMSQEKREKNLSIVAKRLAEMDNQYLKVFHGVHQAAKEYEVHPSEIRITEEYPEDFEW